MKIIAFGHRKYVGKDTCGRFLVSYLRTEKKVQNVQRHGFADKLKDVCFQLYRWAGLQNREFYETNQQFKDLLLPTIGKSARQIWIDFATLVAREVYPFTWVDYLFNNNSCDIMVVTDLRFPNECERIHYYGGLVIKIDRPSIIKTFDIADEPLEDYKDWDDIIINDGTMDDLYKKVITLSEKFNLGG